MFRAVTEKTHLGWTEWTLMDMDGKVYPKQSRLQFSTNPPVEMTINSNLFEQLLNDFSVDNEPHISLHKRNSDVQGTSDQMNASPPQKRKDSRQFQMTLLMNWLQARQQNPQITKLNGQLRCSKV